MAKRSDLMTKGPERAPHRSLLRAEGFTDWEIDRPIIGIANSFNEIIPGHMHLDKLVDAVKAASTRPAEHRWFSNHRRLRPALHEPCRMKYSLPSRELIADSLGDHGHGPPFDGLVLMASCDKIIPGMLIAAARLNILLDFVSAAPCWPVKVGERRSAWTRF